MDTRNFTELNVWWRHVVQRRARARTGRACDAAKCNAGELAVLVDEALELRRSMGWEVLGPLGETLLGVHEDAEALGVCVANLSLNTG
jgi:hypothetical protein